MEHTLKELIRLGHLRGDEELTLNRRSAPQHGARLTVDGMVVTDDGKIHRSLSGAARHVLGRSVDGWKAWRLSDGRYIDILRHSSNSEK